VKKFTCLTATACPLNVANIDTDQLLPARFLKVSRSAGLGKLLLHDLRLEPDGSERSDFPLNQPAWRKAGVVVAGPNFGGGSSREAAVYALCDFGIRCVIAPSFGDIFAQNSIKNGLLPAVASAADVAELAATLERHPELEVTVDLETQTITCGNYAFRFSILASWRDQLLNGWDEIDLTRSNEVRIRDFREQRRAAEPWVFPTGGRDATS
jgi:3-isopropylmalate/(R)-2-methylmalate dehydratase small subunit